MVMGLQLFLEKGDALCFAGIDWVAGGCLPLIIGSYVYHSVVY